jgi:hypothetical protein
MLLSMFRAQSARDSLCTPRGTRCSGLPCMQQFMTILTLISVIRHLTGEPIARYAHAQKSGCCRTPVVRHKADWSVCNLNGHKLAFSTSRICTIRPMRKCITAQRRRTGIWNSLISGAVEHSGREFQPTTCAVQQLYAVLSTHKSKRVVGTFPSLRNGGIESLVEPGIIPPTHPPTRMAYAIYSGFVLDIAQALL